MYACLLLPHIKVFVVIASGDARGTQKYTLPRRPFFGVRVRSYFSNVGFGFVRVFHHSGRVQWPRLKHRSHTSRGTAVIYEPSSFSQNILHAYFSFGVTAGGKDQNNSIKQGGTREGTSHTRPDEDRQLAHIAAKTQPRKLMQLVKHRVCSSEHILGDPGC